MMYLELLSEERPHGRMHAEYLPLCSIASRVVPLRRVHQYKPNMALIWRLIPQQPSLNGAPRAHKPRA